MTINLDDYEGLVLRAGKRGRSPEQERKLIKIIEMHEAGATLQEIGDDIGMTRERVRQYIPGLSRRRSPKVINGKRRLEQKINNLLDGTFGLICRSVKACGTAYGYRYYGCRCNACTKANSKQMHEYWKNNPETYENFKAYKRERYANDPKFKAMVNEAHNKWMAKNKEYPKEYYHKNREKLLARRRELYREKKERENAGGTP